MISAITLWILIELLKYTRAFAHEFCERKRSKYMPASQQLTQTIHALMKDQMLLTHTESATVCSLTFTLFNFIGLRIYVKTILLPLVNALECSTTMQAISICSRVCVVFFFFFKDTIMTPSLSPPTNHQI